MSKKRIVHIVPVFGQGGVQTGMLYSLEALNKVYDYKILVLTDIHEEWIKDLPAQQRSQIITTGAATITGSFIKGYRLLKQLKPDLVISSMWKSSWLSASYKILNRNTSLAAFFHTSYTPHLPYRVAMKLLTYLQDFSLADSNVTKDYVSKAYKTKSTHVIPYLFPFRKQTAERVFDPHKEIRLAYFGIISPVKRVDRALEFCRLCKQDGISFIFDIYAHGPIEEYNNKIGQMGLSKEVTIKKTLPLEQVIEHMQQYDFLLQLSDHEGMALSVVEAMNCGLVPLVTPVGEIARYSEDGKNALWLTRPFDEKLPELLEKFKKVIADPEQYNKMSSAALITFDHYKKYSEALLEVLEDHFRNAAAGKS